MPNSGELSRIALPSAEDNPDAEQMTLDEAAAAEKEGAGADSEDSENSESSNSEPTAEESQEEPAAEESTESAEAEAPKVMASTRSRMKPNSREIRVIEPTAPAALLTFLLFSMH